MPKFQSWTEKPTSQCLQQLEEQAISIYTSLQLSKRPHTSTLDMVSNSSAAKRCDQFGPEYEQSAETILFFSVFTVN